MSTWDKFEDSQLPPIEASYSNLNMSNVSDEDYEKAQRVWKEFRIRNLGEYHDLYLKTVVILVTCLRHLEIPVKSIIPSIRHISIHLLYWLGKLV